MRGTLLKKDGKWSIKYFNWVYESKGNSNNLGNYTKRLKEFFVELDPINAEDVESLVNTNKNLENKEVRFAFKKKNDMDYAVLKNPNEHFPIDEIEQEILNESIKKEAMMYEKTKEIKIKNKIGFECMICDEHIEITESKGICDDCLETLKILILEKRSQCKKNDTE